MGPALPEHSRIARPRRKGAPRRRVVHALWQGRLHFLFLRLVPRVAGRRCRRLPPLRQHAERRESPVMEDARPVPEKGFEKVILDEPPPFLGTWGRVYRFVLIYLAAIIFLAWLFTKHYAPPA